MTGKYPTLARRLFSSIEHAHLTQEHLDSRIGHLEDELRDARNTKQALAAETQEQIDVLVDLGWGVRDERGDVIFHRAGLDVLA